MAIKVKPKTLFVDYEVYEGDTLEMLFNYKNVDTGMQVDLAGVAAKMDVKTGIDAVASLTLTHSNGITIGGLTHNIVVTITSNQTRTLGIGNFVYDIELMDTQGRVSTLVRGKITIKQSVTQ